MGMAGLNVVMTNAVTRRNLPPAANIRIGA
jgi:hypothetical protein